MQFRPVLDQGRDPKALAPEVARSSLAQGLIFRFWGGFQKHRLKWPKTGHLSQFWALGAQGLIFRILGGLPIASE